MDNVSFIKKENLTEDYYMETSVAAKVLRILLIISAVLFVAGVFFVSIRSLLTIIIGAIFLGLFILLFSVSSVLFFFAKRYSENKSAIVAMFVTLGLTFVAFIVFFVYATMEVLKNIDFNAPELPQINVTVPIYFSVPLFALSVIYSVSKIFAFSLKTKSDTENAQPLLAIHIVLLLFEAVFSFFSPELALVFGTVDFYVFCALAKDRTYTVVYDRHFGNIPAIRIFNETEKPAYIYTKVSFFRRTILRLFTGKRLFFLSVVFIALTLIAYPKSEVLNAVTYTVFFLLPLFAVKIAHSFVTLTEKPHAFAIFGTATTLEYVLLGLCGLGTIYGWNLPTAFYVAVIPFGIFSLVSFIVCYRESGNYGFVRVIVSLILAAAAVYFIICIIISAGFYDVLMMYLSVFSWAEMFGFLLCGLCKRSSLNLPNG